MTVQQGAAVTLEGQLEARGVSRRTFLKFCGAIAVMVGLGETAGPKVAQALEEGVSSGKLKPCIWLELSSCTGCTESLAQVTEPDVATIVLDVLSLNYAETLSWAAGYSLEEARKDTIKQGGYICVVEGAVTRGWDGNGLRIAGEKGTDILAETAEHAVAVIAAGSCAVDGGWVAAAPNPSNACGVQEFLNEQGISTPVINLPACPVNPEWIVAVLVDYLLMDRLPELDSKGMPTLLYGSAIHDNCPRRGHFENGEFVYEFGSVEEAKGYCLYPLGCKGPQTYSHCPITRWNDRASWCVEAGAPCIGCASADPGVTKHNWVDLMTPFLKRHRDMRIENIHFQAIPIAVGLTGLVVVVIAAHAWCSKKIGRTEHGAPYEPHTEHEVKVAKKKGQKIDTKPVDAERALEFEIENRQKSYEDKVAHQDDDVDEKGGDR